MAISIYQYRKGQRYLLLYMEWTVLFHILLSLSLDKNIRIFIGEYSDSRVGAVL